MNNTLLVKNFGPIINNEGVSVEICPVTVFCGDQATGKSTVAKLISEFSWLEKALSRGDFPVKEITQYDRFRKKYCAFHSIDNYFKKSTYLRYDGTCFIFEYRDGHLSVISKSGADYVRPQVMYVPAERNLLSAIEHAEKIKRLPASLSVFLDEYLKALRSSKGVIQLPLNGFSIQYDKLNRVTWVAGQDFKVRTHEAASGLQSVAPLSIVSNYLASLVKENNEQKALSEESAEERLRLEKTIQLILRDKTLEDSVRVALMRQLNEDAFNRCFINIVEEPEQNLFPRSQRVVLNELLKLRAKVPNNKLIFTTHSPYMINFLTLSVKAGQIKAQYPDADVSRVVPDGCEISSEQLAIYQLTSRGEIFKLSSYEGLPSDDNYLNQSLEETNTLFGDLLDTESNFLL